MFSSCVTSLMISKMHESRVMLLGILVTAVLVVGACGQSASTVSGVFPSNFHVSTSGYTRNKDYVWSLSNNTGSLQVRGQEYTAFAYWTQVMDTFGGGDVWWINVVGIANDGSNLAIVYLDCTNGKLQNGFWEEDWSTFLRDHDINERFLGTSCEFTPNSNWNTSLTLPMLKADALPTKPVKTGITISGASISLTNNIGWIIADGRNFTILPISTVNCDNCASNCGNWGSYVGPSGDQAGQSPSENCYQGPWYEIHHAATLTENGVTTTCFGIFYLFRQDHTFAQWNYTFCMPEISSPQVLYNCTWSGSLGQGHSSAPYVDRYSPRHIQPSPRVEGLLAPTGLPPASDFNCPEHRTGRDCVDCADGWSGDNCDIKLK